MTAVQITALREHLNFSQGVFATLLRTNISTLRYWEQDRAQPIARAAPLLKLMESAPEEIFCRLLALGDTKDETTFRNT